MYEYLSLASALVLFGLLVNPRKFPAPARPLPDHYFKGLEAYLEGEEPPCEQFWRLSGGLAGVRDRITNMWTLVSKLQYEVSKGRISGYDAGEVWKEAVWQVLCSLAAVPESLLSCHKFALYALQHHWSIALRVTTLCEISGRNACATQLPILL